MAVNISVRDGALFAQQNMDKSTKHGTGWLSIFHLLLSSNFNPHNVIPFGLHLYIFFFSLCVLSKALHSAFTGGFVIENNRNT